MKRITAIILVIFIMNAVVALYAEQKNILFIVSNVIDVPGHEGVKTGVWGEELIIPYTVFKHMGYEIDIASPSGGAFELDMGSMNPEVVGTEQAEMVKDFREQNADLFKDTIDTEDVDAEKYVAFFVPGGHGVMFDVATDDALYDLTKKYLEQGKIVSSVCHGPCFLVGHPDKENLIDGYKVTGFTDVEEDQSGMTPYMPFSLEKRLNSMSGERFESSGTPWSAHVVPDRNLITGQNPASSEEVAQEVLKKLGYTIN